jgi:hypothetical protein
MPRQSPKKSPFRNPPRKNVLLLTCMDQRLLDNTVEFMNELNLQNRYDHVIFAGAAMGARRLGSPLGRKNPPPAPWKEVFFDHLLGAINLLHRPIKDIFLLEHLDCGAYKYLHPDKAIAGEYRRCTKLSGLAKYHRDEAREFAREIRQFCEEQAESALHPDAWQGIRVRCFLMDLLGKVRRL